MESKKEVLLIGLWALLLGTAAAVFTPKPTSGAELNWDMGGVEARVTANEKAIEVLKAEIARLKGEPCNCKETGICLCDARDCKCPECPEHTSQEDKPATESTFTETGRKVVTFGASWCVLCPQAERIAEARGVPYYQIDDGGKGEELGKRYHVKDVPAILLLVDGKKEQHGVGLIGFGGVIDRYKSGRPVASGATETEGEFRSVSPSVTSTVKSVSRLTNPNNWTVNGSVSRHIMEEPRHRQIMDREGVNINGLSHSQLIQVHANLHDAGRSGIIQGVRGTAQPTKRVYIQPTRRVYQSNWSPIVPIRSYSGCPNCRF